MVPFGFAGFFGGASFWATFGPVLRLTLEPYHRDHALVVGIYRRPVGFAMS